MNIDGVDASISGIVQVDIPAAWASLDLGAEARLGRTFRGSKLFSIKGQRVCDHGQGV